MSDRNHIAFVDDGSGLARRLRPAPEMFDPQSKTRGTLRAHGIDFETDKQVWDWVLAKDLKGNKLLGFVHKGDMPADRTFVKDAWVWDGTRPMVDMNRAREIWRNKMRLARASKFTALDIEYQRADEADEAKIKKDIAAQKNALRDVTDDPRINAAKDPDELKAVWPDILK